MLWSHCWTRPDVCKLTHCHKVCFSYNSCTLTLTWWFWKYLSGNGTCPSAPLTLGQILFSIWVRFFLLFFPSIRSVDTECWAQGYKGGTRVQGESCYKFMLWAQTVVLCCLTWGMHTVCPVISAAVFLSPSETILWDYPTAHKLSVLLGTLTLTGQVSEQKFTIIYLVIEKAYYSWRQCGMIWGLEYAFTVISSWVYVGN